MAKVGNEAKLILRLARAQAQDLIADTRQEMRDRTEYLTGYRRGILEYQQALGAIVANLEEGKL